MAKASRYLLNLFLIIVLLTFFGCYPALQKQATRPEEALKRVYFFYPDFQDDMELSSLAQAIRRNLEYLKRLDPDYVFHYGADRYTRRHVQDSQEYLLELISKGLDSKELIKKIKKNFLVYRATGRVGNRRVLFTGYYEPIYEGSLTPDEIFQFPLYRRPDDLIRIDLSLFRDEFKGKTITARVEESKVLPYYSRKQIESEKALEGRGLEIAWLKDPMDVTFLHIQGSGRLKLPDGRIIPVGYLTSNGRPYRSIGRYMLEKSLLSREEMSMQGIRNYLSESPETMEEVLNHNPSYVFFQTKDNGPFGNINVILTAGRSIALDSGIFPKGSLSFISGQKPTVNSEGEITGWTDFSRFVMNQDTGGAIRGAGRADIFWGSDQYAEVAAGHTKHEGKLYILIKKP